MDESKVILDFLVEAKKALWREAKDTGGYADAEMWMQGLIWINNYRIKKYGN